MAKKREDIGMRVHQNFFNNVLEPERMKLEKQIGRKLSQTAFTGILAMSGARLNYPKMDKRFMPRKIKFKL